MSVLRAVLDANVLTSALIRPQGPPGQIMALLLKEQAFELITSDAILKVHLRSRVLFSTIRVEGTLLPIDPSRHSRLFWFF